MGEVVDIGAWRRSRREPAEEPSSAQRDLDALERAVQRLHSQVSKAGGREGQLGGNVETELLAIMGELTVGLVRDATRRAERLASRLAARAGGLPS
jgi:hypothetical protein